jgi:hypothetical protein|nr:MAG: hypothetical protein [uncultured cyanophage]WFD61406.1 MAG: hypothetical protein [uncultured cyanophage]
MTNSLEKALQSEYCTPLLAKCLKEIALSWKDVNKSDLSVSSLLGLAQDYGVKQGYYAGAVTFVLEQRKDDRWISIYRPEWVESGSEILHSGLHRADILIRLQPNGYISVAVGSEDYYCHVRSLDVEILSWMLNIPKEVSNSSKNFMIYWNNCPRMLGFQKPQLKMIAPKLEFKVFMNEIELF